MESKRILVVEDDQTTSVLQIKQLEKLGYSVSAAVASGEDAIKEAENNRPDLVLMDIHLAGAMDGVEAADRIRAQFKIPVLYLTAYSDEDLLQRAKITEPFAFIIKPVKERELHSNIEMALYRYKVEAELRKHRYDLEKMVEERTNELVTANGLLQQEVAEHKLMKEEFKQKLDKMKADVNKMIESLKIPT